MRLQSDASCAPHAVFLRMVLPGWPQHYLGQKRRGRLMLGAYLALLLLGVFSLGTTLSSLALGLALAVHASSIADVVLLGANGWRSRIQAVVVCWAAVGLIVYYPPLWALSRAFDVSRFQVNTGQFAAGDVIVLWHGTPKVGDVVVFQLEPARVLGGVPGGYGMANYQLRGYFVDRIIAGPGQSVSWQQRQLLVDGRPSEWQPLNPQAVDCDLQFVVPADYYGILPGYDIQGMPQLPPHVWQSISCVPRWRIVGRAVAWQRPLWRWRRF